MKLIAVIALSVLLHVLLGWAWTLAAGIVAGLWVVNRAWLVGALGVGGGWLLLVAYNFVVAPGLTGEFVRVFGGLMGPLPGFATVVLTVGIGLLIGLFGALIGRQVRVVLLGEESEPELASIEKEGRSRRAGRH